jgi:prefoldin subunit 5
MKITTEELMVLHHMMEEIVQSLQEHKEALEILGQRLSDIDRILYTHKEAIETLQNYTYKLSRKKEYLQ